MIELGKTDFETDTNLLMEVPKLGNLFYKWAQAPKKTDDGMAWYTLSIIGQL